MSIVVRRLGNADDVAFSTGLGGVDATTYGTIAVLFRPSADTVFRWIVKLYDATGGDLGGVGLLSNGTTFWKGASIWATEGPSVTFDDWHLLVARKNTGDVRPRFSLKNIATGIWVHADAVDTQLDWVAPTGGSVRTKDATSGEGPGADYAAAAIWANELPWAADTFGDAAIEAAGLDEHLDNWRDADPASGWEFSQPDAATMVEDFTLNRADETSVGVGTPTTVTDLDFVYATAGILALSRNFLRDTQNEPGATGIIRDLSETQGTPTTIGSGLISSGSFTKVLEFWRVVDATVDASVAIDTSISMAAVSAATLQYQWIVHRYNSADVLQESSTASSAHNTTGVKTQTMVLAGPFVAGDKLSVSLWLKKAGGGGSRSFTLSINNADSWVEFSVAETSPEEHSGSGTAAGTTLTAGNGTGTPAATGAGQAGGATLTPATGAGTPAVTGTGTPASLTLTAGIGTGSAGGEEHSGSGTAAGLTLTAEAGAGIPAITGSGTAAGLTLTAEAGAGTPAITGSGTAAGLTLTAEVGTGTPAVTTAGAGTGLTLAAEVGTGTPAVTTAGAGTGLTLAAQSGTGAPAVTSTGLGAELILAAGLGQGGTGAEQHSGDGATATLALIAGQGAGSPAVDSGGLTCTLDLVAALGTGSLVIGGAGEPAVLLLVAGLGLDVLAAAGPPPEQRIYRVLGEVRAYRVPSEDRTYRIVR